MIGSSQLQDKLEVRPALQVLMTKRKIPHYIYVRLAAVEGYSCATGPFMNARLAYNVQEIDTSSLRVVYRGADRIRMDEMHRK